MVLNGHEGVRLTSYSPSAGSWQPVTNALTVIWMNYSAIDINTLRK